MTHPSPLLSELERACAAHPLERKLLLCESPAQGRELLHALAAAEVPWAGWEPVSLRQLAHELAAPLMARDGIALADDFDVLALLDEAVDGVGEGAGLSTRGFREATHRAVLALREAGLSPDAVRAAGGADPKLRTLSDALAAYEAALAREHREDRAGVFRRALAALRSGEATLPDARIFVLPGLETGDGAGRLLRAIAQEHGAQVMEGGREEEPSPPASLHFFAAATPMDELREVLRRVLAQGIPWDRVEIVATDPSTYGPALDTLARRLGIPVTSSAGLPAERTRVGRAVRAYFQWISEGFPAEWLLRLLEASDLAAKRDDPPGTALARRLRRLRVGWGRERYLPLVRSALLAAADSSPTVAEDEDHEEAERSLERERRELSALNEMLQAILGAAPPVPDRVRTRAVRSSPAAVATGLLAFLDFVPAGDEVENVTRGEIRRRLERARRTLTRETGWESAISILRGLLSLQVASHQEGEPSSWTSRGGALHLSGMNDGGLCHRPYAFVVGLDAGRTGSPGPADPLLSDSDRVRLNQALGDPVPALLTTADRLSRARKRTASMLARLRGSVTLSYSAWDAAEGRAVSPAPELLEALRGREADPFLNYDDLRTALGPLACAVPRGDACLDGSDVWLAALAADGVPREGRHLVRDGFPDLDRGLRARALRGGDEVTGYHGRIGAELAGELLGDSPYSASRLETLGACPRHFFYRYLLGIHPAADPEWDPEAWLDAAERGSLLHAVYERTLRRARDRAIPFANAGFATLAEEILEAEVRRARERVPPPTERVFALELEQLRADVALFVRMVRENEPAWLQVELDFGDADREVTTHIGSRTLRLRGKIDRVDRAGPGTLRVIDYKTGSARRYHRNRPFAGGRRVQHVVYRKAASQLLDGEPTAMEYHFPTARGENRTVSYPAAALEAGDRVLEWLLDLASAGDFLTTENVDDCRYCDYRAICRAQESDWGAMSCDLVAWSKARFEERPEFESLRALRGSDG